jgi:hypothetical protein
MYIDMDMGTDMGSDMGSGMDMDIDMDMDMVRTWTCVCTIIHVLYMFTCMLK